MSNSALRKDIIKIICIRLLLKRQLFFDALRVNVELFLGVFLFLFAHPRTAPGVQNNILILFLLAETVLVALSPHFCVSAVEPSAVSAISGMRQFHRLERRHRRPDAQCWGSRLQRSTVRTGLVLQRTWPREQRRLAPEFLAHQCVVVVKGQSLGR